MPWSSQAAWLGRHKRGTDDKPCFTLRVKSWLTTRSSHSSLLFLPCLWGFAGRHVILTPPQALLPVVAILSPMLTLSHTTQSPAAESQVSATSAANAHAKQLLFFFYTVLLLSLALYSNQVSPVPWEPPIDTEAPEDVTFPDEIVSSCSLTF